MKLQKNGGGNAGFYQKLFELVLPIAFQQFMLTAVSASDALMLGFVSQDSLSAVSLAGQITFVSVSYTPLVLKWHYQEIS